MAPRTQQPKHSSARASWADIPTEAQESEALSRKSQDPKANLTKDSPVEAAPLLAQLLKSIPTPARRCTTGTLPTTAQRSLAPSKPPTYAPELLVAPTVPPPPPCAPPPTYAALGVQWGGPPSAAPLLETAGASYRERLRAGGRGAFQRAADAGLGNGATQEWSTGQVSSVFAGAWPQCSEAQGMQNVAADGSEQMWAGMWQMPSNDFWGQPMAQPQMPQCQGMQYAPQLQPQMAPQTQDPMQMPPMPGQQFAMTMPSQASMHQSHQSQMLPQMPSQLTPRTLLQQQSRIPRTVQAPPMAQAGMSEMQALQMPMSQVQVPTFVASGDSTPVSMESCMEIVMPGAAQISGDKDLMVAQLQAAAAACQCYED